MRTITAAADRSAITDLMVRSKSLAKRRSRLIHPKVRSTTHRLRCVERVERAHCAICLTGTYTAILTPDNEPLEIALLAIRLSLT